MSVSAYSYSTQSSTKILQLQDHVSEYYLVTFVYEVLTYFKHVFYLMFLNEFASSGMIDYMGSLISVQCLAKLSECVSSAAFELISPRIGTTYSSAGKIAYNYGFLMYAILSVVFYIVFGLLQRKASVDFFLLGPVSYALEAFLYAIGRVERWNGVQMVSAVLCPATQIILFALASLAGFEVDVGLSLSYLAPSIFFGFLLAFYKKYLRVSFKLFKPFRWHLLLQVLLSIATFVFFDACEDMLVLTGIWRYTDQMTVLAIMLYYLCMRIAEAATSYLYYYVIQAQRLFLITKQGSKSMKTKTLVHSILAVVWSLAVFLLWNPVIHMLIGNSMAQLMEQNARSHLLDYSKYGALRGVVKPLYAYEIAYARARRCRKFVFFNETVRSLSMLSLYLIAELVGGNSNFCSIFTVQTVVILMLGVAGLKNVAWFKRQHDVQYKSNPAKENPMIQEIVQFSGRAEEKRHDAENEVVSTRLPNQFTFVENKKDNASTGENTNNSINTARGFHLLEMNTNNSISSVQLELDNMEK